jgi:hypothetical protein
MPGKGLNVAAYYIASIGPLVGRGHARTVRIVRLSGPDG